jgi:Skp family chaperone for outer membrane proteins
MKKSIILALVASAFTLSVSAQKYAVVNTQKVYQAIEAYAEAVEEIDELATAYQKNIDEAYQKVEEMYQNYMIARDGLTYEQQKAEEQNIIANEQKIPPISRMSSAPTVSSPKNKRSFSNPSTRRLPPLSRTLQQLAATR